MNSTTYRNIDTKIRSNIVYPAAFKAQKKLERTYRPDSPDSKYYQYMNFNELSNEGVNLFIRYATDLCYEFGEVPYFKKIKGEQRHTPLIPSSMWGIPHTWCFIQIKSFRYYVDITAIGFKGTSTFYSDIPKIYISHDSPKWFYPDEKNMLYRGVTKRIDDRFRVRYETRVFGESIGMDEGIIEYLQYEVWGKICDRMRKD